jgi:hypothetical protein
MRTFAFFFRPRSRNALGLVLLLLWASPGRAQGPSWDTPDWSREPLLPRDLVWLSRPGSSDSPAVRANRIRLFRIQPGFLSDPVGLDLDDPTPADPKMDTPSSPEIDVGPRVSATMGNDNPFFDFQRPGDVGGVGFFRMHSQVQLFDNQTTGCALGLQAVTPAGLEYDGLPDGPTVVSPAFSLFHTLDDGTAFQGFVGKNVHCSSGWSKNLHRSVQYGMAVQRPLTDPRDGLGNFYVFVEALGRYHYDSSTATGPPAVWEVLPGLHWRVADNWWLSGGVIVPVTPAPRSDTGLWQFTCSVRF